MFIQNKVLCEFLAYLVFSFLWWNQQTNNKNSTTMRQTIPPDITPIMVIISFSMFCCPEISVVDQVLHGGISVTATKKNEKK